MKTNAAKPVNFLKTVLPKRLKAALSVLSCGNMANVQLDYLFGQLNAGLPTIWDGLDIDVNPNGKGAQKVTVTFSCHDSKSVKSGMNVFYLDGSQRAIQLTLLLNYVFALPKDKELPAFMSYTKQGIVLRYSDAKDL